MYITLATEVSGDRYACKRAEIHWIEVTHIQLGDKLVPIKRKFENKFGEVIFELPPAVNGKMPNGWTLIGKLSDVLNTNVAKSLLPSNQGVM